MIKQITDTIFSFTYAQHQPAARYGDDPYLDSLGATQHLSPTYSMDDKEEYQWITDNDMPYTIETRVLLIKHVIFENEEDAMAFKLRWL